VEDEPAVQANVAEYLSNYFGEIHLATNGEDALERYRRYRPNVLLLDINLPDIDGLTIAKKIREKDPVAKIVMLTAFTEQEKLLKATELKLTKYLVKPVAPKAFKEMLALLAKELRESAEQIVRLGEGYVWNLEQATLSNIQGEVTLTDKEYRLLRLFIEHKGKTVSYERICYHVWDNTDDKDISQDSIKNQVSQLRRKLPENSIASVYGEGYMLK
jgi:DNA-binding response OmpR family regulator